MNKQSSTYIPLGSGVTEKEFIIYYRNSHRQWYEEYHKHGVYWAKFWLTSGKQYAQTPKHIIRWILESHYQKKFK